MMDRFKALRTVALSACFATLAGAASALCSNPPISNADTVFRFGSSVSGVPQGGVGTKSEIGGRKAGTVYYDHAASSLRLCDGSNWVGIGESGSGSSGGTFPVGTIWTQTGPTGTTWNIPFESEGTYHMSVNFEVAYNNSACEFEYRTPSGAWNSIIVAPKKNRVGVGFMIKAKGSNRYDIAQQYWDSALYGKIQGDPVEGNGILIWRGIQSNVAWSGRVRQKNVSNDCTTTISVWRTE